MSTTQKPEPGTAVSKKRELTPQQQAIVDERRLHSHLVQQIKSATWGTQWNADTIAAVAAWARENDVDPITEIDVLGGTLYVKASYFIRILSQLVGAGMIDYHRADWVHVDKRLEKLADAGDQIAKAESKRRLRERIGHNLSDDATHACVYRIKHRLMNEEVTGAKEFVPGKRKDPVGEAMPMETIETRSIRRAMRKLEEAFPQMHFARTDDDAGVAVAEIVKGNHDQLKRDREVRQLTPGESTFEPPAQEPEPVAAASVPVGLEEDEDTDESILRQDRELVKEEQAGLGLEGGRTRKATGAVRDGGR